MAGLKLKKIVMSMRWSLPPQLGDRIIWESRRAWHRLGWRAAIGIFCCSLTLLVMWQIHVLVLHQQFLSLKLQAVQSAVTPKPTNDIKGGDVERQLSAFYAYLPAHDAIPDQLKLLINLAEKYNVTLSQAEYKPQPELNADFLRYQIILPIKADYPDIQTFILAALQALPTLTLESVAFKRDRIESGEVKAQIQFMLLVKKPLNKGRGR